MRKLFFILAAMLSLVAVAAITREDPPKGDDGRTAYRMEFYGMTPDGRCRDWRRGCREHCVTVDVDVLSRTERGRDCLYECEMRFYDADGKVFETRNRTYAVPQGANLADYVNPYGCNPSALHCYAYADSICPVRDVRRGAPCYEDCCRPCYRHHRGCCGGW